MPADKETILIFSSVYIFIRKKREQKALSLTLLLCLEILPVVTYSRVRAIL
jgi:hypothetical protein